MPKKKPPPTSREPPAPVIAGERYLGIKEIAQLLNVHPKTVQVLKRAGKLPPHSVFGYRTHRWKESDILAWVSKQQQ